MTTAEENPPRLHTSNPHTHKKLTSGQTDRYGIRNRLLLLAKCPAHLGERRILKLTDPLAGYPELTTDFFQSESLATAQSESLVDDAPFAFIQNRKQAIEFGMKIFVRKQVQRVGGPFVANHFAEFGRLALIDRSIERCRPGRSDRTARPRP